MATIPTDGGGSNRQPDDLKQENDGHVTQDSQRHRNPNESQESHRHTSGRGAAVSPKEGENADVPPHRKWKRDRAEWFKAHVQLPFGEFIAKACTFAYRKRDTDDGLDWHSDLFWFVWMLRAHADMAPLLAKPKQAMTRVETVLRDWSASCARSGKAPFYGSHKGDPWMDWFEVPKEDARTEFTDLWMRCRFMPGHDPLAQARDAARRMRLLLPDNLRDLRPTGDAPRDEHDYEFFVSIAGHLQVIVGDQNIYLPCREIGELLAVSPMTVSRFRRWAVDDGFLRVAKGHQFKGRGQGDATEFRFNVGLYSALTKKASPGAAESFENARYGQ